MNRPGRLVKLLIAGLALRFVLRMASLFIGPQLRMGLNFACVSNAVHVFGIGRGPP